jgi:hypothetical protein
MGPRGPSAAAPKQHAAVGAPVSAVDCDCPLEGRVDGAALHPGLVGGVAVHVEVDGVCMEVGMGGQANG